MKKKHIILLISFILWLIILVIGAIPFDNQSLKADGRNRIDMLGQMGVFVDASHKIAIQEVSRLNFKDYQSSKVSGSLSDATYWIRILLPEHNQTEQQDTMWLIEIAKPQLDSIRYYQLDGTDTVLSEGELGRKYPFSHRIVQYRNYIIPLKQYTGTSVLYLAVNTQSYLQVPVTLWKDKAFYEYTAQQQLLSGLFYGALIIMIFYHSVLGLVVRDKAYYYFVGFILSFTLVQCVWDGYSYQYLWPHASGWDLRANPFFIDMSVLCLLLFTKIFLKINKTNKIRNHAYLVAISSIVFAAAGIFVLPIHVSVYISMGLAAAGTILCFWSLFSNRLNSRPEKIYMIAWQLIFAGNILNILAGLKLYPYTIITMNAPKAGMIALLSMFSLALADRINQIEYQKSLDKIAAQMDGLTKVFNRTYFFKVAEELLVSAGEREPVAILMVDIDHFKDINDTYGHLMGDAVLLQIIPLMKDILGENGILGRYGGDEFIIIINKPKDAVLKIAEQLHETVKRQRIKMEDADIDFPITISVGIAQKTPMKATLTELIAEADKALYLAKERGRDQIAIGC